MDRVGEDVCVETVLARHKGASIVVITGNRDGDHGSLNRNLRCLSG